MGVKENFTQLRAVPIPTGNPPLVYVPYSFGQMKPIPIIGSNITLALPLTEYLRVFLPANIWADQKIMYVKAHVVTRVRNPNQVGGPLYQEAYQFAGTGMVNRLPAFNVTVVPAATSFLMERQFYRDGANIIEANYNGHPTNFATSMPDGIDHGLRVNGAVTGVDFTLDNYLYFYIRTTFLGSTDTVQVTTAQAWIQSPLDLRRLPR